MTTSGWALRRTVEPEVEPLTLAEAKEQCQVDADLTEQDANLRRYIRAARELAESYTRRSFVEQTWRLTAWRWPVDMIEGELVYDDGIVLRNGPVIAIDSISYLNDSGERIYMAAADYRLDDADEPARLYPAYNETWITPRYTQGSVEIIYRAGYPSAGSPADAENVPAIAKQAMAMLIAHWFNNARETSIVGPMISDAPMGFYTTLDPLRIYP